MLAPQTFSNSPQEQPGSPRPLTFLHCPTNRNLKGTAHIIQAVKELHAEGYNLTLHVLEKQPHEAVLAAMQEADVVIDQLIIGWYGMVAVEAWALGKPVICYIRPDLCEMYYVPALSADAGNIKDAIKCFLKSPEICDHWGRIGRAYVEKVHDIRNMDLGN